MNFFKLLKLILMNEMAESAFLDEGQGNDDPDAGQSIDAPETTEAQDVEDVSEGTDVPEEQNIPAYVEAFGVDATVDLAYEKYQEKQTALENMKSKTAQTEKSLYAMRQAVERSGMQPVTDSDGNVYFLPVENKGSKRQPKFTDDHRKKLSNYFSGEGLSEEDLMHQTNDFIGTIDALVEEKYETIKEQRQAQKVQEERARQDFNNAQSLSWNKAKDLYPSVDPNSEDHDKVLFDRADKILMEKYSNDPSGQLYAVIDAAKELGRGQSQTLNAKKEAFKQGQASKKVMSVVGSAPASSSGKLTYSQYRALPKEKQIEYNKKQIGL